MKPIEQEYKKIPTLRYEVQKFSNYYIRNEYILGRYIFV